LLRSWLGRLLGEDGFAAAEGPLKSLATDVMGPLRSAHADAEAHPPVLHQYDGWGDRTDRIEVEAPAGSGCGSPRPRHALVAAWPYLLEARRTWGAQTRVVQHALLHLYRAGGGRVHLPASRWPTAPPPLLSRSDVDTSAVQPCSTAGLEPTRAWPSPVDSG